MQEKKKDNTKEYIKANKIKPAEVSFKNKKGEILFNLKINPNITFAQRSAMIDYICEIVFENEDRYNIKNYNAQLVTFAKRCATLRFFTDLEMPDDIETLFALVMNTTIYEEILPYVQPVLNEIMTDVDETLKTYRNTGIYNYNFMMLVEKLGESVREIMDKFKDINLEDVKNLLEKTKNLNTDSIVEAILKAKE